MKNSTDISILVIEDEDLVRNSIQELLELKGYNVYSANNGKEGIQIAATKRPNLILSDIMMPNLSGLDVLESLKSMPESSTIPFIFLTAKAEKKDVRHGMELGADDYLAKPFSKKELYNAIDTQLEKYGNINRKHEDRIRDLKLTLSVSLPHELRTPLNGIHSAAQFLLSNSEGIDLDDRMEMYQSISQSSVRLSRLIQNYLLYTELELYDSKNLKKPDVTLKNCSFDPDDTIITAINNMKEFESFEGEISEDFSQSLAFAILIKPNHLLKIVEELVSNAFKFHDSDTQPVLISSKISEDQKYYLFEITNICNPLSAEEIDSISSYVQFSRDKNEQQGLGLGLFIVKCLIDIYNGELIVDSAEGKGNRFKVKLPITTSLDEL